MKYRIVKYTDSTGEVTYSIEQRRLGFLWWSENMYHHFPMICCYRCPSEEDAMEVVRSLMPRKKEIVREVEG